MRSPRRPTLAALLSVAASALVAVVLATVPAAGTTGTPGPTPTWAPVPGTPCPSRPPVEAPEPTASAGPVPLTTPVACLPLGTSSLGGRVTDEDGAPVAGVTVRVRSTVTGEATVSTDGEGRWAVGSLPAGSYRISFDAWEQGFVSEYWDDAPDATTATLVTVAEGESVRSLQTRLVRTATVSGRVVAPDGPVPSGTVVMVDDTAGSRTFGYAPVQADGSYEADGLPPGSYVIRAVPPDGSAWGPTYYPDARGPATATPVTVTSGQRLAGLDVTLQTSQGISGTVSLPPGTDPSRVLVVATPSEPGLWMRSAGVAADGTYRMTGLLPGSYTVHVENAGADRPVARRWYPDSATADGAQPVVVVGGADTTGIDIAARAAARVTGVVTGPAGPLWGVVVTLESRQGGAAAVTTTAADGSFAIGGLSAGDYRIRLTGATGGPTQGLYFRAPSGTVTQARAASTVSAESGTTVQVRVRVKGSGGRG